MEIWRDAAGFEGFYEISDQGNARRKGKKALLAKPVNSDGYIQYCFSINNKRYNVIANLLVLRTFVGPVPYKQVSRHKNGKRSDNRLTNLEYGTPAQNSEDMVRHGTQAKGTEQHLAKLDEYIVRNIRCSELSNAELGHMYNVDSSTIRDARIGKTWKHVPFP